MNNLAADRRTGLILEIDIRQLLPAVIQASNSSTDQGGGKRRALAGCTQGAASIKLKCVQKPTDWIEITTGFNGRAIHGSYAVEGGIVKVKTRRGERATQVEGVSNPIWLAVWLLRELAKEGKA